LFKGSAKGSFAETLIVLIYACVDNGRICYSFVLFLFIVEEEACINNGYISCFLFPFFFTTLALNSILKAFPICLAPINFYFLVIDSVKILNVTFGNTLVAL
jgi:hypothetical protein